MYEKVLWILKRQWWKLILKKNNMKLLTKEQQELQNAKSVVIVKKSSKINIWEIKNTVKLEIIVIIQGDIEVLCIGYGIWNTVYLKRFP